MLKNRKKCNGEHIRMYSMLKVQAGAHTTEQVFQQTISVDHLYNENLWRSSAVTTEVKKGEINNELKK